MAVHYLEIVSDDVDTLTPDPIGTAGHLCNRDPGRRATRTMATLGCSLRDCVQRVSQAVDVP